MSADKPQSFVWPDGATAAVSLTYDDGNENNLDNAIPHLREFGLRGTFYLTVGPTAKRNATRWKAAAAEGHEMANHTVRHPARLSDYPHHPSWLKYPLEHYSPEDIREEIDEAAQWLDTTIGSDADRSFCYPCFATAIGDPPDRESYRSAVARHHRFGRVGLLSEEAADPRGLNDPLTVDLEYIDGIGYHPSRLDLWIGLLERAVERGAWAVPVFHGIGGPSHDVSCDDHRAILEWLVRHNVWVAPLKEVACHVQRSGDVLVP